MGSMDCAGGPSGIGRGCRGIGQTETAAASIPSSRHMIGRLLFPALACALLGGQTPDREAAVGAQLAAEIRRQTTVLDVPGVHEYVQCVARRIETHLPDAERGWELSLIQDDSGGSTREPLAIPRRRLFVSAHLLLAVRNEAELAGMLAQAMARGTETRAGSAPVWIGVLGSDDRELAPIGNLKRIRESRLRADSRATAIMAAAGYDPAALVDYIGRTQRALPPMAARYSALPPRAQRISGLEAAIANESFRAGEPCGDLRAIQGQVSGEP